MSSQDLLIYVLAFWCVVSGATLLVSSIGRSTRPKVGTAENPICINIADAVRNSPDRMHVHVKIVGVRRFNLRMACVSVLLWLASKVSPWPLQVDGPPTHPPQDAP